MNKIPEDMAGTCGEGSIDKKNRRDGWHCGEGYV